MSVTINGTNGLTFNDASTQTTAATGFGFKNRIINGAMVIDQRYAGAATANTINGYTVDRWVVNQSTTGKLIAQQSSTAPTGFSNSLLVTSQSAYTVGASDYYMFVHYIEGFNFADMVWGTANAATITLSFWVRSSLTGTFGGGLKNGGSNRTYPFTYTISAANTWEQKTLTITGDTTGTWVGATNGTGLIVQFGLGAGATFSGTAGSWQAGNLVSATGATSVVGTNGATFYITGVQLEKGSTATSFDYRPYGTELILCQRYFEKSFPQATAPVQNNGEKGALLYVCSSDGGSLAGFSPFKVTKRASPTIVGYNPNAANGNFSNGGTANFHVVDDTGLGAYTTTLTGARATINWTASAEL